MGDLLEGLQSQRGGDRQEIAPGAWVLRGFCVEQAATLLREVDDIAARAPFRQMPTRQGGTIQVAMTNCGRIGWVSDRSGYRYDHIDPLTGQPWPELPASFAAVANSAAIAAGFAKVCPDACLVNRYSPGTKLSLHQDRDELDHSVPIVSVSLGLPAIFQFGGMRRRDPTRRVPLEHGDVVVWGGPSRLVFHGIASVPKGEHPQTGRYRINLTFRTAGPRV